MSDQLETLIDIAAWVDTEERMSAMEWAIDQLRWRRVADELPPVCRLYQVVTNNTNPDYAYWFDGWDVDGVTHWRPIELPKD